MTHEALYYAFYYITAHYTQPLNETGCIIRGNTVIVILGDNHYT